MDRQKCLLSKSDFPASKHLRKILRLPMYRLHYTDYLVQFLHILVEAITRSEALSLCKQQGHCDVITRYFSFFSFRISTTLLMLLYNQIFRYIPFVHRQKNVKMYALSLKINSFCTYVVHFRFLVPIHVFQISMHQVIHGYLDNLDRNEKTKVYMYVPEFRCDATYRLK